MDIADSPDNRLRASICRSILRPVASILLRCGMSFREFSAIAKNVFVEVAVNEFGIRGRPTNTSRVAMLTGISRNEVKRQRDLLQNPEQVAPDKVAHAAQVLFGWHMDAEFTDEGGQPRVLPVSGSGASFEKLYDRYGSRDVPFTTILKELTHVGAIERLDDDHLRALSRYYMPSPTDPEALRRAASVIADLATTVRFNLYRKPRETSRFEGRAQTTYIPRAQVADFRVFLEDPAQQFLEHVDAWLSEHENRDGDDCVRLGVGVYEIQ